MRKILLAISSFLGLGHAFDYDLHLHSIQGTNQRTMICFHGYGDSYRIALALKDTYPIETTLVSFNFPEYDINERGEYDPEQASFGTIKELLPAFYVMKKVVLDQGLESIDLYGRSAGGGAAINVLATLNTSTHDAELKKIGITIADKKRLLAAIDKGVVLLDVPLKSVEEIMDFRGRTDEFKILAKNYKDSNLRPIDSLKRLRGLSCRVLLYFAANDEILSNRDDQLYIDRLKASLPEGKVTVMVEDGGGHNGRHEALWQAYNEAIRS